MSINDRVRKVIFDKFDSDAENLVDLDMDSLSVIELIMALEDEFDISIHDDALETCSTVSDIVDCIEALHD